MMIENLSKSLQICLVSGFNIICSLVQWLKRLKRYEEEGLSKVSCVTAETEEINIASQRVLQKSGFRPTGEIGEEGPK